MEVILVGSDAERARVRARAPADLVIVGEAPTMAAARALHREADAWIVAIPRVSADVDFPSEPLTPREREVLDLLAEGMPNKEIAARLGISAETAKFHVAAICGKLGAANRTEAVRVALRRGLLTL